MNELIPISEQNGKRAVSARDLHRFLKSKQEFTAWIKNRIKKYGLVENHDYQVFDNFIKNPTGGRKATSLCKERGIETDSIPDPRFGVVKTYPSTVLDEVFNMPLV